MAKMTGAQVMADMLKGYGVTNIFHVPAVLRTTMVELEKRTDIKRLHVHSEATSAYMADGYARATGEPGVCMAQVIGALHLAAGLRDAWLSKAPVIGVPLVTEVQTHPSATGVQQPVVLETAVRFCIEVATSYGNGDCEFYYTDDFQGMVSTFKGLRGWQSLENATGAV